MSYEPLHHKYRPKSFAELVGQEAIATTLTNAICAAKIAPAYLFTGPRGTGKTSSARILAKSLNCLKSDKPTPQPCGVCAVCQGITRGYSLDVTEIDAASNTGVENVRDLIEKAQFAAVQCRYKVYVIDECHMLSTQAFNALLKTLEEPPKHVVFVLATTDPQRVLPTIISRCQRFDFRRIALQAMVKHLSTIASQENIKITDEAVTLVAQIAQGGLRDAESLLDQLSLLPGEVTPDQVWDLVGSVSERDLLLLLQAIASDNPEAVLSCTRTILDRGREPLTILQNLAAFYRDLLIALTAPSRNDLVACTHHTWKELIDFAQHLEMSTILVGQQQLRTAEVQLKNTTQPRLWLEVTILGLLPSANITAKLDSRGVVSTPKVSPPAVSSPQNPQEHGSVTSRETTTVSRDTAIEGQFGNLSRGQGELPPSPPTPPTPPSRTDVPAERLFPTPSTSERNGEADSSSQALEQIWQQVVESLSLPGSKAFFKEHGRLLSINDGLAQVGMPSQLIKFASGNKVADLEAAFVKVYQQKLKVSIVSKQSKIGSVNETQEVPKNVTPQYPQPSTQTSNNHNVTPQPHQQSTPTYNNHIAPAPEIAKSAKTTTVKTESATNKATMPTPTSQPNSATANWETDEVALAAQRLAQFFDGEIIRFTDDKELPNSVTTSEWVDEADADDEF